MTRWTTPGFSQIADLVRDRTGLIFPDARVQDVEATIRRAMERRGLENVARLAGLLAEDDVAREEFVAELTIGESYFQRDPGQLDMLRERVLPDLLSRRPGDRPLRVWSAGCASGEEPYTVAMLFDQLDILDRCAVVGTDIARARLDQAQRGVYSSWSLRNSDETVRDRYFTRRGRLFELTPRLRSRVDFRYLNLAEDQYPSLSAGVWGMDVILCRNVLIYFDRPTVERVARRLMATLSEDGWLLLGASDPAISEMVDCDVVLTDAGLAYRRPAAAGASDIRRPVQEQHVPVWEAGIEPAVELPLQTEPVPAELETAGVEDSATADRSIEEAYGRRDFDEVIERAAAAEQAGTLGERGWTAWVRALANQGCLDEAGHVATRALAAHGSSAELLYLHAVLLLQAGLPADAGAAARRALYMDRRLVVAHLTLAESHRQAGSLDASRLALRNAAALLAELPPESEVPASDGELAGRLAELVRVKERLLEAAS